MLTPKKLISIVVPAFNEEACVDELARRLVNVFDENRAYDFEVILVENGSTDRTAEFVTKIAERDPRFKMLQLARNFRMDGGITAGLAYVSGDACVIMTADLQDPPELITKFIAKWEDGFENVYMEVTQRRGTGPLRTFNSKAFYWLAGKLTSDRLPRNASDFRLVDRKVYQVVRSMDERNRFVRGLFAWVGFKTIAVKAERPERFAGESKAHSLKVIDLAFRGIFAHSYVPLRLITILGVALSVLSVLALVFVPTLIGHLGLTYLLKYMDLSVLTCGKLLEPILASIIAYYVFNEVVMDGAGIAFTMTAAGVIILFWPQIKSAKLPNSNCR